MGSHPHPKQCSDNGEQKQDRVSEAAAANQQGATKSMLDQCSLSLPMTREHFQKGQAAKGDLPVDSQGTYHVKHSDSLWNIAERRLHKDGGDAAPHSVFHEVNRIKKLNESSIIR